MQKKKISVLHSLTDRHIGGAGTWLVSFLSTANQSQFRYGVILPQNSALIKRLPKGINIIPLPIHEKSFCIKDIPHYFRAIKAFQPDILQTHGSLGARIGALLASPHTALIVTKHCIFENATGRHRPLGHFLYTVAAPFTHAAIATADCAARALQKEGMKRTRIITVKNGALPCRIPKKSEQDALRRQLGIENRFVVGFCGRLEPDKNPLFILKLASLLRSDGRFFFLVVGDGSLRPKMMHLCKKRGLSHLMHFTGYLDDVSLPLSLFDAQINCSLLSETSNMALLEGFSLGVPAVASLCGGNRETVRRGISGMLYKKNNAAACADCLRRLASDTALHDTLSRGARQLFEKEYHSRLMTARCETFYRTLVRQSAKRIDF